MFSSVLYIFLAVVMLSEAYLPQITLYNNSNLFLCQDIPCAEFVANRAIQNNSYIVAWQTHHFAKDPYIAVYYDRIHDLLEDLPVYHVIFDANGHSDGLDFLFSSISYLPSHTIFIALQDSAVLFDICALVYVRTELQQYPAPVLFHLNQEYPWRGDIVVGSHKSGAACAVRDLHDVYSHFGAVFRNYFHSSLVPPAHYLTLGSAVTDVLEWVKESYGVPKTHQRQRWCLFAGRLNYRDPSPYHSDRHAMVISYEGSHHEESRACEFVYDEGGQDGHRWSLEEYALEMLTSVFVLCPAGNNPETFRHYEAMELGAVPIFVIPPSDVNFLQFWNDYPGPVFSSWDEAFQYIDSINGDELSLLQYNIYAWYMYHKHQQKQSVTSIIKKVLPIHMLHDVNDALSTEKETSSSISDEQDSEISHLRHEVRILRDAVTNLELRVRLLETQKLEAERGAEYTMNYDS